MTEEEKRLRDRLHAMNYQNSAGWTRLDWDMNAQRKAALEKRIDELHLERLRESASFH